MTIWTLGIAFDRPEDRQASLDLADRLSEQLAVKTPDPFRVVLHNDPINGADFVVDVIKTVFGYGTGKAFWLMLKAHVRGQSSLWLGSYSDANRKRQQMIAFGADPNKVIDGAKPLTVTIEKDND